MKKLVDESEKTLNEILLEIELPVDRSCIEIKLYSHGNLNYHALYSCPLYFVKFELSTSDGFLGTYITYYEDGVFFEDVLDWD